MKRTLLVFIVLVCCAGYNQATKSVAESYLGDTLSLQLAHNHGAFLSMESSLPENLRDGIFSLGVCHQ